MIAQRYPRWYNPPVVVQLRIKLFVLVFLPFMTACSVEEVVSTPQPTQTLRPYRTLTPIPTSDQIPPTMPSLPPLGPTPTPLVHIVQSGETLLGIAIRYAVELEQLLLANPGIDPRFLSIGQEVIIPGPEGEPIGALLPTPTPLPLGISGVSCFPTPSGSLWCLVAVRNETSPALEGVSVLITLFDSGGEALVHEPAYGPLNLLPEEGIMPLAVFFSDPPAEWIVASANLLSAVEAKEVGSRYSDLDIMQILNEPSPDGLRWQVQGEVGLPIGASIPNARIRMLLIAFDEEEEIIGFSFWESDAEVEPGDMQGFNLVVFSLGPVIHHVEVMAEAQFLP
ncbi:MAG: LysM peptidoglycan-binding domain-containing protein [Anaerolineaceae bacterium]|nr:MAG: LysM peptidoglycan-binding domain-containing protein [Anaerolineaceae bacterium]